MSPFLNVKLLFSAEKVQSRPGIRRRCNAVMRRTWFALICLSACSLSACLGQTNNSAKEDGYVFCQGAWKYTSKGKQLGWIASEVEVEGQKLKPVPLEGKAAYREGGAIYFATNMEGESGRFLCYSRAGDASWKILARDNVSPYGLSGVVHQVYVACGRV